MFDMDCEVTRVEHGISRERHAGELGTLVLFKEIACPGV